MDLSQQELPLTAYFTRGNKETKSRTAPYNKDRSTEDSQLVARPTKRRKSNVQSSTTSSSSSSARQSKPTTLQLPTPAASTRKRTRNRRLESAAKTPLMSSRASSSPAERNATPSTEEDPSQLDSRPIPLKLSQSLRKSAKNAIPESSSVSLVTPSIARRRTKLLDVESHPNPPHFNLRETGMQTPRTSSRRTSEPSGGVANSNGRTPSNARQTSAIIADAEISHSKSPFLQHHSARSTSHFPVSLDFADPFRTHEKGTIVAQQDSVLTSLKQHSMSSNIMDVRTSDSHAIPMIPVSSSQSQYLLHLDATPKRKRCLQRIERVVSSQTQEERELSLSTPLITMPNVSGVPPGRCIHGISPLVYDERKSQRLYTLGCNSVGSPIRSPIGLSSTFVTAKKALNELSNKSSSPSWREKSTPNHSPSRKARTHWRSPRHGSIENIPPAYIEESVTESESESDILQLRMKCKLPALNLPSRGMDCGSVEGNLPGMEDDSATEAESDTEILRSVAEISRKRYCDHRCEAPREDTPPPPVISPLVSPTRPRNVVIHSITSSTQFLTQGAELSIPGSCPPYSATVRQPHMPSEALPEVVREFISMFPGDESYPADFPESLRV